MGLAYSSLQLIFAHDRKWVATPRGEYVVHPGAADIRPATDHWGHVHQAVDTVLAVGQPRHQVRLMASPATCFQFAPASAQFALDPVDPAYRIIELAPDGSLTTQLQRVPDLGFSPDPASTGY